jgi:hypothetical protein
MRLVLPRLRRGILLVALASTAAPAEADEAAAPANYVAGFLGTTVAYRPPDAGWDGWQRDATGLLGYGRYVSPRLALELDLGPTYVRGDYASFALVPGAVWIATPNLYLAARFVVPVDPETRFVMFPGVGVSRSFGRVTPIVEVNLSRTLSGGKADLGVALTVGVLLTF